MDFSHPYKSDHSEYYSWTLIFIFANVTMATEIAIIVFNEQPITKASLLPVQQR